jgi:hypothetical protein
MTLLTLTGAAVAELLADPSVAAITTRIRPVEPAAGDAQNAGSYIPFVVVAPIDAPWRAETATSVATVALRCYAATYPAAEALYLTCAAVFHRKGPRIASSRLGIYGSLVGGGPTLSNDPDTKQPYAYGLVDLRVSIQPTPPLGD